MIDASKAKEVLKAFISVGGAASLPPWMDVEQAMTFYIDRVEELEEEEALDKIAFTEWYDKDKKSKAEIARLKAENGRYKDIYKNRKIGDVLDIYDSVEKLQAEIERLKDNLHGHAIPAIEALKAKLKHVNEAKCERHDYLEQTLARVKGITGDDIRKITDRYMGVTGNSDLVAQMVYHMLQEVIEGRKNE